MDVDSAWDTHKCWDQYATQYRDSKIVKLESFTGIKNLSDEQYEPSAIPFWIPI